MDAHSLPAEGAGRFCYAGSVLHTRATALLASRSPMKIGAELYGEPDLAADIEIIRLMLETLRVTGIGDITLDLGHLGICRRLLADSGLEGEVAQALFEALQGKSPTDLEAALAGVEDRAFRERFRELAQLHGDIGVLDRADWAAEEVAALRHVAAAVAAHCPEVNIYFDLAELRGYHYHTGLVFAAYAPGHGRALANGGRYDDVGQVFGRARPATGFSADLKALLAGWPEEPPSGAISAPAEPDADLRDKVNALRAAGEVVITSLSGEPDSRCDRVLTKRGGEWAVQPVA